jgi:hypothetical protein
MIRVAADDAVVAEISKALRKNSSTNFLEHPSFSHPGLLPVMRTTVENSLSTLGNSTCISASPRQVGVFKSTLKKSSLFLQHTA